MASEGDDGVWEDCHLDARQNLVMGFTSSLR